MNRTNTRLFKPMLLAAGVCVLAFNPSLARAIDETKSPVSAAAQPASKEPASAEKIGLQVGDKAPDASVKDSDGNDVKLADLWAKGPLVVVFYRGGWCPFCNKHLAKWAEESAEVKKLGATLASISPETPDNAKATKEKDKVDFLMLSDIKMEAAKGFKLVFSLGEDVKTKYRGYGIDLEKHNANRTWELPHPGTYVIDTSGTIRYASVDTDYKKRPDPAEAMNVLRELTSAKK